MIKYKKINYTITAITLVVGVLFLYQSHISRIAARTNAPKISFKQGFKERHITSISFERNGLFLNDSLFNAGGISGYSRVHYKGKVFRLKDFNPPFVIRSKKPNNDTLKFLKEGKVLSLLIDEEIRYSRLN